MKRELLYEKSWIKTIPIIFAFFLLTVVTWHILPLTFYSAIGFPLNYYFDVFFLIITCVIYLCFIVYEKKQIKTGIIPYLMIARVVLMMINSACKGLAFETAWNYEKYALVSLVVYLFVYNFEGKFNFIRHIVLITCFITSLQLITTSLLGAANKHIIGSGLGLSNTAATFVLMCVTYLMFVKKNLLEIVIMYFGFLGLFFSQSFGGYVAFAVIAIIYICKMDWKSKKFRRVFFTLLVVCVLLAIVFFSTIGKPIWKMIDMKFTLLFMGDFNAFGAGRVELYEFSIKNITKNIWFGQIENVGEAFYKYNNSRTHNFILESLLLYGIVGSVLNLAMLIIVFRKGILNGKADKSKKVFGLIIIAVLVHGLVEPNFFTTEFSAYFWLFATAYIKPNKYSNNLTFNGSKERVKVEKNILAFITTFNPQIDRLKENITAVISQVSKVVVFDNNSNNKTEIKKLCALFNIDVIFNKENIGTAGSLNFGVEYAYANNFPLILTLDQDSIIDDKAVDKLYLAILSSPALGMVGCNVNGEMHESSAKEGLITSGSLAKTDALKKIGNYDKSLFIDLVDNEICFKLFRNGYDVKVCLNAKLNHSLGEQTRVKFLGLPFYTFHYSPLRLYYQFRNAVYLKKIYREQTYFWNRNRKFRFFTVLKILLGEKDKREKLSAIKKAKKDGKKMFDKWLSVKNA